MRANRRTTMGKKRHTPEEIVSKLRQVDVLVAQGTPVADAVRTIGVTEVIATLVMISPEGNTMSTPANAADLIVGHSLAAINIPEGSAVRMGWTERLAQLIGSSGRPCIDHRSANV